MSSFTTLVNTDVDAAQKLASFIALLLPTEKSESFITQCNTLIDSVKANDVVLKFLEHASLILALEEDQFQGVFEAIFSVIFTLGETSQESVVAIREIIRVLTADHASHADRRLMVLIVLFNLVFTVESKVEVLLAIFKYASETSQLASVSHFTAYVPSFLAAWKLSHEQQRHVLRTISSILEKDGHYADIVLSFNIRYLQTFKSDNATINGDVDAFMKQSVLQAINSPVEAFQDRASLLDAFHGLKVQGTWSALLTLLKILCDGSLDDFNSFRTSHAAVLKENSLSEAVLEHKVKLLALCSLGNQGQKPISFQQIQSTLKLSSVEEVELWLIEAISSNLMNGSIDQLNGTVTISRYAHRSFGMAQWKGLQSKLRELRKNITAVKDQMTPAATNKPAV